MRTIQNVLMGLMLAGWAGEIQAQTTRHAYTAIQAENEDASFGVRKRRGVIDSADNGDWLQYKGVNFGAQGANAVSFRIAVSSANANQKIEIRSGAKNGPLLGTFISASTGSRSTFKNQSASLSLVTGVQDIFLVFPGREAGVLDSFVFQQSSTSAPAPAPVPTPTPVVVKCENGQYAVNDTWFVQTGSITRACDDGSKCSDGSVQQCSYKVESQKVCVNENNVGVSRDSGVVRSNVLLSKVACPVVTQPTTPPTTEPPASSASCPAGAISVAVGSSIQSAVNAAAENASFCLRAGVHRMQTIAPKNGQKFYGETGTILSGSRLLTSFSRDGNYYVATGQTQQGTVRGMCTRAGCAAPEALFINDKPLLQVTSKAAVIAGTFYFDYAADSIYFLDNPDGKKVEATVTPFAFRSTARNVLIKGLVIEKYATPAQEGAIQGEEAVGWVVDSNELRFNHGAGVSVGTNGSIINNNIHHNGQLGLTAGGDNILIQNNEIVSNNIYGFMGAWEAGGAKVTESDGVIFRNNRARGNDGPGLWCDENCINVLYEDNLVESNTDAGIFHEISYKAVIRNNIVRNNGLGNYGWIWGADIQIAAAQDVEVYGNTVVTRAGGTAIVLVDQNRGPTPQGGMYKTQNNYVHDNDMTFVGLGSAGAISDSDPGDENYNIIATGNNRFNSNIYRVPRAHAGEDMFEWNHSSYTFSGLKSQGQEANGQLISY